MQPLSSLPDPKILGSSWPLHRPPRRFWGRSTCFFFGVTPFSVLISMRFLIREGQRSRPTF